MISVKRIFRRRCSPLLLFLLLLGLTEPGPGALPPSASGDPLLPAEIDRLEPGDFILRRGSSLVSSMIARVLGGDAGFSHCGVLIPAGGSGFSGEGESGDGESGKGESWLVVHSVSRSLSGKDGLQAEGLEKFVRASVPESTAVVRLRLPEPERSLLVGQARERLRAGASFDYEFRLAPDGPLYCSELLWLLLPEEIRARAAVYQQPGNIIRFETFLDPRYFSVILDHRPRK